MNFQSKQKILIKIDEILSGEYTLGFGVFNAIHPGHIRYLENARSYGLKLIIAVSEYSDGKDGQNTESIYSVQQRAESIAELRIVDHVVIVRKNGLSDLVKKINPKYLVLGKEYEDNKSQDIGDAINFMKGVNGHVKFHAGEIHYANTGLYENDISDVSNERKIQFQEICKKHQVNIKKIIQKIHDFKNNNILVIGDTIIDHYVSCDALGMSSEAPVLVVKELDSRNYIGGAAVVASHIAALGATCHYISVIGDDDIARLSEKMLLGFGVKSDLISDSSRPTTYKTRFLVEKQKIFRVSKLTEQEINESIEKEVINKIKNLSGRVDGIIVSDFVYGVITQRILNFLVEFSKKECIPIYGDLQCSTQVGNITKFKEFTALFPTEKEARIAISNNSDGIETISKMLMAKTKSKNLVLKMGSEGFIVYENSDHGRLVRQHFPALCVNPVDLAGAGDSLMAGLALGRCAGLDFMASAALGACMAALSVQTLGNIPIGSEKLIKFIKNF